MLLVPSTVSPRVPATRVGEPSDGGSMAGVHGASATYARSMREATTALQPEDREVTVFLVDDHELVRRGVRDLLELENDLKVVCEAGSVAGATARIPSAAPDVVVLDWRLPDGTGLDVCRDLHETAPATAVLVLTSYDDDGALFAAIMAGVAGYVLKQVWGHDLVDAIRRVGRGQSLLDPAVTARVLARLREGGRPDPLSVDLTAKEEQVLELVALGLTNRQIATRLGVAEKTVKNRVSLLLAKLGVGSRTQAAVLAAHRADGAAQAARSSSALQRP